MSMDSNVDIKEENKFKIVAVGDGAIGKTCLLVSYSQNLFPDKYIPTVFDNYRKVINYEGEVVNLSLWDTAGQEDLKNIRYLSYPETDLFLILFAVDDWTSYQNIKSHWSVEIKEDGPENALVVLVATKIDLRDDEETVKKMKKEGLITAEAGEFLAKEINASAYMETSAKEMTNVNETFQKCVEVLLDRLKGEKREKEEKEAMKKSKKGVLQSSSSVQQVDEDVRDFLK